MGKCGGGFVALISVHGVAQDELASDPFRFSVSHSDAHSPIQKCRSFSSERSG